MKIAVVAHRKKTLGGGLSELRELLHKSGYPEPFWQEVSKSRFAPKAARRAVEHGADLIFVWGGDGTIQRCVDALATKPVTLALLPAGTANLLATNLEIPIDLEQAVEIGLTGDSRKLDVGVLNGHRFAVMGGVGLDAIIMENADGTAKEHFGRLAYIWSGLGAIRKKSKDVKVQIDGKPWFKGKASCILIGQMNSIGAGLTVFPDASPDDGLLEVGVITAKSFRDWSRLAIRLAVGQPEKSPLTKMSRGTDIEIKFNTPMRFEVDGGARKSRKKHVATIEPGAITVKVPKPPTP